MSTTSLSLSLLSTAFKPESALLLLSGGMDSTTLLAYMLAHGVRRIEAISINYGQRHFDAEFVCASMVADSYGIQHRLVDISSLEVFWKSPLIIKANEAVPVYENYHRAANQRIAQTYVPRRNTVLLAIAAATAEQRDLRAVAYGAHVGDANYPDCSREFAESMNATLQVGSDPDHMLSLYAPFIDLPKADLVAIAADLKAPLGLTHSCYQGHRPACGVCDTCQERIDAFKECSWIDPIEYEIDIDWGLRKPFPGSIDDENDEFRGAPI